MATVGQAAAHLCMAERNFFEMLDRGVIQRQERAGYDLDTIREQYIRHLQKVAAGREKKTAGNLDPEYERARKDKELADRTALQNQVSRGELVSVEEVGQQVEREYAVVRERILAIPGLLGGDIPQTQVQRVLDQLRDALDELHDTSDIVANLGQPDGETDFGEADT